MKTFNICDYGATISDSLQTRAIQNAIDACYLAGGGRVVVPCGIYHTGGFRLRSNTELYLESGAILKGSRNPDDYNNFQDDPLEPVADVPLEDGVKVCRSSIATSDWCNGLIRAYDAENISVIGEKGSYIDGNNCFDPNGEEGYRGPHGMSFWCCKNIHLEGYTFINSANWCHAIFRSQNIAIKNISVYGGHDGVDVRTCDNVLVENCVFNVGDDCIAGFDNHDVTIRNCVLNTACMPMRFGGNNVLVENCTTDTSTFGIRHSMTIDEKIRGDLSPQRVRHESHSIYSYYCDDRAVIRKPAENIVFRNCHIKHTRELIRLEYTGLHRWCTNRSLRSIRFENCTIDGLLKAGMLWGDENEKVICHFKNVTISCREGKESEILIAAGNFERIVFEDCKIEGYSEPTILVGTDDAVEIIRSTPIRIVHGTKEDCLAAHPGGIAPQDKGKNIRYM